MKTMTTIRIEKEILQKAQELGFNISKACEFALSQMINAVSNIDWCGRRDLNPGSQAWKTCETSTVNNQHIDWEAFEEWLLQSNSKRWSRYLVNYARPYHECLLKGDLSPLQLLPDTQRPNVIKGLSALAKFLGTHEEFKMLLRNYGLKWTHRSSDDLLIDRITKVQDPNEIFTWIRQVKWVRPELAEFLDLMAVTGMRLVEAVEAYNLIIRLARKGKLDEYYKPNGQIGILEHYKFKDTFIRKSKKIFISFVPNDLIERICKNDYLIKSRDSIQKAIQTKGMQIRLSDIREMHASLMTKHLQGPEIDFLHGRVSANVFMKNYFNPAMIADLKQRVSQGIAEIQTKLS